MNHAAFVRSGQTCANLPGDLDGFVAGKSADSPDQRSEILAIDVLHGQKWNTVGISDIKYAADIGMRDLPRDAHLRMEPRERAGVLGQAGRKKLDRHDLAELEVFGAIDFAHAAAAGECHDTIAVRDDLPGGEPAAANGIGARHRTGRA